MKLRGSCDIFVTQMAVLGFKVQTLKNAGLVGCKRLDHVYKQGDIKGIIIIWLRSSSYKHY